MREIARITFNPIPAANFPPQRSAEPGGVSPSPASPGLKGGA
jgi:hypothetical protein